MTAVAYWFDLDGTLLDFDTPFAAMLADTLGIDPDGAVEETFRRRLFVALDGFEDDPYRRGYEAVAEAHDLAVDPASAAADHRERELAASRPVDGAKATLRRCGDLGRVGILTNGDGAMQRAKVERHGLDALADAVVISNEVGVRKPDPAIFELAAAELPADLDVYVGDTYEEDVAPAFDAGFLPVHVRHDDGPPVSLGRLDALGALLGARGDTP